MCIDGVDKRADAGAQFMSKMVVALSTFIAGVETAMRISDDQLLSYINDQAAS